MATGSGKTYAAVNSVYRLIKHAKARRILFLVDRKTLGEQALNEFRQFATPDDGRKFTELYNVQHMTSNTLDKSCMVCISTIQRMFSMLKGRELDEQLEEQSSFEYEPVDAEPVEIEYNLDIPIEYFDFHNNRRVPQVNLQTLEAGSGVLRRLPDRHDEHYYCKSQKDYIYS